MTDAPPQTAIVVGASAGALDALGEILPWLPADYPSPVIIVVHLPPDKDSMLAEVFRKKCKMAVKEAEDKEPLSAGTIYFAPPDYHLLVEQGRYLSLSSDEPVLFSRPAIDVLFETAAEAYGEKLTGIVLTGANEDGAKGLRAIVDFGGKALVQSPDHAFARAMPEAALKACPEAKSQSLPQIRDMLLALPVKHS